MTPSRTLSLAALLATGLLLLVPGTADAYVGPGAGVALLSSFLVLFTTVVVAIVSLLIWPFRTLWRIVRRKQPPKAAIGRLIVVGLDGQDPRLTDRFMAEGKLPNFKRLAELGSYHRIETSYPALSPVAWSSFSTGTNPGKHNIFDFLNRDLRTYLPTLSSTAIGTVSRYLKLGKIRIPLEKPELRLLRKSKPFWTILGEHNIWSTVLRVPITFPPDRFYGAQLAAMCVPDLLGTQGTFLFYTTRRSEGRFKEGGLRIELQSPTTNGDQTTAYETQIEGPENTFRQDERPLRVPMRLIADAARQRLRIEVGHEELELEVGVLSDWVKLEFPAAPAIKVEAICRMMATEVGEHVSLYISPLNISPEKPVMPISHPSYYAPYLSKAVGDFSTLGLAEDTWALNEGITDDATFLQQTYDIDKEREEMFWSALSRLRKGSLICVFDATDRIQHMFWRYLEKDHPAARGIDDPVHKNAIEELYKHNDQLIGRVVDQLKDNDLLMVLSDHGFESFRRGVNLNRWFLDHGLLTLKEGEDGNEEWLRQVDWSKTKAYALGLSGVFLNLKGREVEGIVEPGEEEDAVKRQIIEGLSGIVDEECGEVAITEPFDTAKVYDGPYRENAPDLVIGFNAGYRTSWDCATGVVNTPLFEDNVKAWSGDHCIDPRLVPGVFFCNKPLDRDSLSLVDIAPTALRLFGIEPPRHMEGTAVLTSESLRTNLQVAAGG